MYRNRQAAVSWLVRRRYWALPLVAGVVAGCHADRPAQGPVGLQAKPLRSVAALPSTTATISFDLIVESSTAGASKVQTIRTHVDRTRVSPTGWQTAFVQPPTDSFSQLAGASHRLARIVIDENGAVTAYLKDGTSRDAGDMHRALWNSILPKLVNLSPEQRAKLTSLQQAASNAPSAKSRHTDWIDNFFATHEARGQQVAALSNAFSTAQSEGAGTAHYTRSTGSQTVDISVDTSRKLVTNVRVSQGQAVLATISHEYVDGPGDLSIRRRMQIQRSANGPTPAGTTTISLSNIVVNGQEVSP